MTTRQESHGSEVQVEVNGVEKIKRGQRVEWIIHIDVEVSWKDGITWSEKDSSQPDAKVLNE